MELDAPNVGDLEKRYITEMIDSGFVSTFGPYVPKFEEELATFLGVEKCVSIQSGTAALHMALYELAIGKGDEVIVPAFTFIATANPVIYVGAKPIFVDVEANTWNINPSKIEERITPQTKAIIPVHLYGNPCDMDRIMSIAKKHNLYVIEDATESLGATYKGKYAGTIGDFGCFSFNGNKIITTGGGGMVVSGNLKRLERIKSLVNQARDETKGYSHSEIGFNYRMTNLEASLGLAQMARLGEFLKKKKKFIQIYKEELQNIESIRFQEGYEGANSSWWLCCIIFEGCQKIDLLQEQLREKGIPARRLFVPIPELAPYQKHKCDEYKNSQHIYEKGLCLPSSTLNSGDDVHYVCEMLKKFRHIYG